MIMKENTSIKVKKAEDVVGVIRKLLDSRPPEEQHKEYFYTVGLDTCNRILIIDLVTFGTVNACHISLREVFRLAIIKNCTSIIMAHNHPSGRTAPSEQDRSVTLMAIKSGEMLGIDMLDHIIIGDNYFSFADEGIIKKMKTKGGIQ